jgi:hypothetical protein
MIEAQTGLSPLIALARGWAIEDPKVYTRPVTVKYTETLAPDTALLAYLCTL